MKTLVLSALVFFPAVNLTAASFNEPIKLESATQAKAETLDMWFADYDMYCASVSDLKDADKDLRVSMIASLIQENSNLTERLLSLKATTQQEKVARDKFFAQLRLERASMTVQVNTNFASVVPGKMGPLMAKATETRDQALRALAAE